MIPTNSVTTAMSDDQAAARPRRFLPVLLAIGMSICLALAGAAAPEIANAEGAGAGSESVPTEPLGAAVAAPGVPLPPNEESLAPEGEERFPLGGEFPALGESGGASALAQAQAELPSQFYGMVDAGGEEGGYLESDPDWTALAHSGVEMVRIDFEWGQVQSRGWSLFERWVEGAARHGITILPDLYGRKTNSEGKVHQFYLKEETGNWTAWLAFAKEMVAHFGYGGSFWKSHSSLTARPFRVWEVWNEPNRAENNPGGAEAQPLGYAEFLSATSIAIHAQQDAQQPGAETKVIFGGVITIKTAGGNESAQAYLRKALEPAYINEPYEGHPRYDGIGVHPYAFGQIGTSVAEKATAVVEHTAADRVILTEYGGVEKTLWITEVGWPVEGTGQTLSTKAEQAELVSDVYSYFKENFSLYNLKYLAYYFYRDLDVSTWDYHAGLRELEKEGPYGVPISPFRPAWFSYLEATGASRWPVAPDVSAPGSEGVHNNEARLTATVDADGLPTSARLEWGKSSVEEHSSIVAAGYGEAPATVAMEATGLEPATTYRYRWTAINENAETTTGSEGNFTTTAAAPVDTSAPVSVSSTTPAEGIADSVTPGGWVNGPIQYGYQWERCTGPGANCAAIPGATASSYAPGEGDVGYTIRVAVSATNSFGTTTETSPTTTEVQAIGTFFEYPATPCREREEAHEQEVMEGTYPSCLVGLSGLASGPDGETWYSSEEHLDSITPEGVRTEHDLFPGRQERYSLGPVTSDASGDIWGVDTIESIGPQEAQTRIFKLTPAGAVLEYALPHIGIGKLSVDRVGDVWFYGVAEEKLGEFFHVIGFLAPDGEVHTFEFPELDIVDVAGGEGSTAWFTDKHCLYEPKERCVVGEIGAEGLMQEVQLKPYAVPWAITFGPESEAWLTETINGGTGRDYVDSVTTGGSVEEFVGPGGQGSGIAVGPDGALWMTLHSNTIGRMTTQGTYQPFFPSGNGERGPIVAGAEGYLWYLERDGVIAKVAA